MSFAFTSGLKVGMTLSAVFAPSGEMKPSGEIASFTLVNEASYSDLSPSEYDSGTVRSTSCGEAEWIHLSARTMALVSAWTVFGFLRMNSTGAYRQPAGIG